MDTRLHSTEPSNTTTPSAEMDLVDLSTPPTSPLPTPTPSPLATFHSLKRDWGEWAPIEPLRASTTAPSLPTSRRSVTSHDPALAPLYVPLPPTPPPEPAAPLRVSPQDDNDEASARPIKSPDSIAGSSVLLKASAEPFARRLQITRRSPPPSFFPGDSSQIGHGQPFTSPVLDFSPVSPPNDVIRSPGASFSPPTSALALYPERIEHSPYQYGAEESWGNGGFTRDGGYLGGLDPATSDGLSHSAPSYNFDGRLLVAKGLSSPFRPTPNGGKIRIASPSPALKDSDLDRVQKGRTSAEHPVENTSSSSSRDIDDNISEWSDTSCESKVAPEEIATSPKKGHSTLDDELIHSLSAFSLKEHAKPSVNQVEVELLDHRSVISSIPEEDEEIPRIADDFSTDAVRAESTPVGENARDIGVVAILQRKCRSFVEDITHLMNSHGDIRTGGDLYTRIADRSPSLLQAHRANALESTIKRLRANLADGQKKLENVIDRLRSTEEDVSIAKAQWALAEMSKRSVGQHSISLEMKNEELQKELFRLRIGKDQGRHIIVLLQMEIATFDIDLVAEGYEGGKQAFDAVRRGVGEVYNVTYPNQEASIELRIFVDVQTVERQLVEKGLLDRGSQFRYFLDGINEADPLVSVIDVCGNTIAWRKMSAVLKQMAANPSYNMIVLGSTGAHWVNPVLEGLRSEDRRKIRAFRSMTGEDPFSFLGDDRLIPSAVLFPNRRVTAGRSPSERPQSPPSRPSSNGTIRARSPEFPIYLAPPAPWRTVSSSESGRPTPHRRDDLLLQPSAAAQSAVSSKGGSLLDRYYAANRPSSPTDSSVSILRSETSDVYSGSGSLGTSRDVRVRSGMTVPIDPAREGSIASSPPSSDEDDPSVKLPHSATRFIQRPTRIARQKELDDAGISTTSASSRAPPRQSAYTVQSQSSVRRMQSSEKSHGRSSSASNAIPLGRSRGDSGASQAPSSVSKKR